MAAQPARVLNAHDKHIVRTAVEPVDGATEFEERHIPNVRKKGSDADDEEISRMEPLALCDRGGSNIIKLDLPHS